jgi:hypothetical protein
MKILLTGVSCRFRSTEIDIYCILSREVVDSSLVYELFIGILDEETLLRRGFFFKLGSLALDLDTGKAVTASWCLGWYFGTCMNCSFPPYLLYDHGNFSDCRPGLNPVL